MKKVMKIVGIALLGTSIVAAVAFGLYWHHNTHWFDKYEKALKTVIFSMSLYFSGMDKFYG